MAPDRRHFGQRIEAAAARFLTEHGLTEVRRNVYAGGGELDLIMRDRETLVFVEVRYRRSNRHGSALESITSAKQRRLINAANAYLQQHDLACACRFDAVAVTGAAPSELTFDWIRDAFGLTL